MTMLSYAADLPSDTSSNANFQYSSPQGVTTAEPRSSPAKEKFERLAVAWRNEVQFLSSMTDIVLNSNYQRIIGQGIAMVPFMLNELRRSPEHWFWALAAITGADPARNAPPGDIQAAADAWVQWGRRTGIIS